MVWLLIPWATRGYDVAIMLTAMQQKFVLEWCKDLREEGVKPNATKAAIRAGCENENSARVAASKWLSNNNVLAAIEERKAELAAAAGLTPEKVLKLWLNIAEADPSELMQIRRVCCRHCHGFGHHYQWTENEYLSAVSKAAEDNKPAPDGMGGFGYNMNAEPHSDCPHCGGDGYERVIVADTNKLSPKAKLLYAGVHTTKDGIKVITRDQDAALANLSKYLGMTIDRKEISGPNGGPIPTLNLKADELTDDQLAAILGNDNNQE